MKYAQAAVARTRPSGSELDFDEELFAALGDVHLQRGELSQALAAYNEWWSRLYTSGRIDDRRTLDELGTLARYARALAADFRKQKKVSTLDRMLRVTEATRQSGIQRAFTFSSARAAAQSPDLRQIVRQEQDAAFELAAVLDGIRELTLSNSASDAQLLRALRSKASELSTRRIELKTTIEQQFPEYRDLVSPRLISVKEIQLALRPDEALIVVHENAHETYAWAVSTRSADLTIVEHTNADVPAIARKLRATLAPDYISSLEQVPRFATRAANALHEKLLKPLGAVWEDKSHLWVVVHGSLSRVPLSVVPIQLADADGTTGDSTLLFANYRNVTWLGAQYPLTYLPTLSTLQFLGAPRDTSRAASRQPLAGFGAPHFGAAAAAVNSETRGISVRGRADPRRLRLSALGQLPPLPETEDELVAIATALKAPVKKSIFVGRAATENAVKSMNLAERRVLVFATHGLLPGDLPGLQQPALAFSQPTGNAPGNDGLLQLDEILPLKIASDWAVLSACNTGVDGSSTRPYQSLRVLIQYVG